MVSRLTKEMRALSQDDNLNRKKKTSVERRKSARICNLKPTEENVHDSGTESDEEEMARIALDQHRFNGYHDFVAGASPPALSATPPKLRDVDTESWDSFGQESGIMTGDNDSDIDGPITPKVGRRRMQDDEESIGSSFSGEKRRHSLTMNDQPIAWRLRSFNSDVNRPVRVAARRIPVKVIYNRPNDSFRVVPKQDEEAVTATPAKRNRRNSNRPSLDFEKMVETRIEQENGKVASTKIVTRSQIQHHHH